MKTHRILGVLWFALCSYILILWQWQMMMRHDSLSVLHFRAFATPFFLFGIVASVFLFLGAKWARIAIGAIALVMAAIGLYSSYEFGLNLDGLIGVFSLGSVAVLLFPRREPVA